MAPSAVHIHSPVLLTLSSNYTRPIRCRALPSTYHSNYLFITVEMNRCWRCIWIMSPSLIHSKLIFCWVDIVLTNSNIEARCGKWWIHEFHSFDSCAHAESAGEGHTQYTPAQTQTPSTSHTHTQPATTASSPRVPSSWATEGMHTWDEIFRWLCENIHDSFSFIAHRSNWLVRAACA